MEERNSIGHQIRELLMPKNRNEVNWMAEAHYHKIMTRKIKEDVGAKSVMFIKTSDGLTLRVITKDGLKYTFDVGDELHNIRERDYKKVVKAINKT